MQQHGSDSGRKINKMSERARVLKRGTKPGKSNWWKKVERGLVARESNPFIIRFCVPTPIFSAQRVTLMSRCFRPPQHGVEHTCDVSEPVIAISCSAVSLLNSSFARK